MISFAFIPLFIKGIIETSRFILYQVQAQPISDLFSLAQSLKPVELLRKFVDSLIF